MKIIRILILALLIPILGSCEKGDIKKEQSYFFLKPYCAIVTVGGFVGLAEKCFKIGDIAVGEERIEGKVTIRIAEHSYLNDGPPSNTSYQEFLDVPSNYLEVLKK